MEISPSIPAPSKANKNQFIRDFGGVFEYSEWIAEKTWAKKLSKTHNSIENLHTLMVSIFRQASMDQKLAVLNAHPDLGAKLIKQKELTKESAQEQASAGLNNLNLEDINTFLNLNKRYIEKHRFPFIIAAKGRTKHSILEAFKERIDNPTELEFVEACSQVELIAYLRIKDILDKDT